MKQLHVGAGTGRGALTVFPIWGEYADLGGGVAASGSVSATERENEPTVGRLSVVNVAPAPVLMFQGQVVEGGWQNRMLARSVVVPAYSTLEVDVVCVEQGRWGGGREHRVGGLRASGRVRSGLDDTGDRQGAVWSRVEDYERMHGATATASYAEHVDRLGDNVDDLIRDLRPLPGQIGVVVAVAGQPLFAEVFDSHDTLVAQFEQVVRAAALDAVGLPAARTPSRRARRFVDRAVRVQRQPAERAGLGVTARGADQYADVTALVWGEAEAHVVMTNPRHELAAVGA